MRFPACGQPLTATLSEGQSTTFPSCGLFSATLHLNQGKSQPPSSRSIFPVKVRCV